MSSQVFHDIDIGSLSRLNQFVNDSYTDTLKSGIILDVAGGRGDLSFELSSKFNLRCVIIDPRPQKFRRWQLKMIKKHPEFSPPRHIQGLFDENFFEKHDVDVADVRLVIGMHPDEATEPLVTNALDNKIPFAVIPCCVFSQMFPLRKLKDGSEPVSYEAFCDYLMEKSDVINSSLLPFLGRNRVIFTKLL